MNRGFSRKTGKKAAKVVPDFCRGEQGDYGITHSLALARPPALIPFPPCAVRAHLLLLSFFPFFLLKNPPTGRIYIKKAG